MPKNLTSESTEYPSGCSVFNAELTSPTANATGKFV